MDYVVLQTERGAPIIFVPMSKCVVEFSKDGKITFHLDNGTSGVIQPTAGGFFQPQSSGIEALKYAIAKVAAKDPLT